MQSIEMFTLNQMPPTHINEEPEPKMFAENQLIVRRGEGYCICIRSTLYFTPTIHSAYKRNILGGYYIQSLLNS